MVRLGVSVLDWVGICILGGRQLQRRRVIADAYRVPAVTEGLPTQPDTGFPEKLTPALHMRPDTPALGATGVNISGIPQLAEEHAAIARPASTLATTHSPPSSPCRGGALPKIHYRRRTKLSQLRS